MGSLNEQEQLDKLLDIINKNNIVVDRSKIEEAFNFTKLKHDGHFRLSGEPYFNHAVETACILAENKFPQTIIIAGLLHDTLDDGDATKEEIVENFGEDVFNIVEAVSKIGRLKYRGEERYAENLRKMLTQIASNLGVLFVKFADRIHNLETLDYVTPDKRQRIATESLEIYSKIANRLNMGNMQSMLEDLSFKYLYPEDYKKVEAILQKEKAKNSDYIDKMIKKIGKLLYENNIKNFKVYGRVKHVYSLYRKMQYKDLSQIFDIQAIRILVDNVEDCYKVLGIIHNNYKPMPNRIKDYIASPKPNGYQSIHTTVFADRDKVIEIQIRTYEMHELNEYGVCSHAKYKDNKIGAEWVKNLEKIKKEAADDEEFLESLKLDLFQNRIFVLTPKGDAIDLPEGATPVDFAYNIHSSIGNRCYQAMVNGKIATLDYKLKDGDVVEIKTKKYEDPQEGWLRFVKTSLARSCIKKWLKSGGQL
ncbi:MAG TPA: RelA/SpoT family protein [bacterium]|nr:bifunctional (p)ppGpp synthetase/guanosine-3',5'-bis(diphosphate) 3'-pyrophosphohydrolase [Patescibacteria group bacterium]HPO11587.1 RelA/SpoT family protein [bacterium]